MLKRYCLLFGVLAFALTQMIGCVTIVPKSIIPNKEELLLKRIAIKSDLKTFTNYVNKAYPDIADWAIERLYYILKTEDEIERTK